MNGLDQELLSYLEDWRSFTRVLTQLSSESLMQLLEFESQTRRRRVYMERMIARAGILHKKQLERRFL